MKKRPLLLFFLLILLFSCGNEDIPVQETAETPIRFSSVINDNSTTSMAGTGWEKGDIIGIYALQHGVTPDDAAVTEENRPFVTTGDGNFIAREKHLYFPDEDASIDIISYYPHVSGLTSHNYPIDISEQPEFLYSNNLKDVSDVSDQGTMLVFRRVLPKVIFTITPTATGESLEGLTASLGGVTKRATFNLLNGMLTQDHTSTTTLPMTISGSASSKEASLILLPTAEEHELTLHISLGEHHYTWVIPLRMEEGKVYRYHVSPDASQPEMVLTTPYMEIPAHSTLSPAPNSVSAFHMVEHSSWLNPSHATTGTTIRNFSVLFDTLNRVPYWVAYPMHPLFLASGNRTDAWEYDPLIPKNVQPNLYSGWQSSTINRGHLLASADRSATRELNKTTFYFTNMVPQNSTMNGGTWVDLEERVRYWSRQTTAYDTLFVVTGAILPRSPQPYSYIYDTNGNRSVVPGHLYKALLRKSKTTGNYSSIAFIMENAATGISYSDDRSVTSVQQLESETGFTFFPNLPEEVAETVKQNSALSPHWK